VHSPHPRVRRSDARRVTLAAALTALIAVGAACGSDADTTAPPEPAPGSAAERGKQLSQSNGCAGCHGANFDGGAGPTWVGLAGSEVELIDGTTVRADDAYLTRAIADPSAELVAGYTLKMPANNLTDDEIADIVAYINTLGVDAASDGGGSGTSGG
jgi:cytochrome c oxidase subunit 2